MTARLGTVVSGRGRMAQKMRQGELTRRLLDAATGADLVAGTLNVRLDFPFAVPAGAATVQRGTGGDIIYLAAARVDGIAAWLVRHARVEHSEEPGSLRIVEFVSAVHLRKALALHDGARVEVALRH